MIKELAKLATKLDRLGLTKEADVLDAALNKLAQAAATTGVPGATYQAGKQVTTGRPGGPTQKFYRSKPKSLSEFNAHLGAVIENIAADPRQRAFSSAVINNLPTKGDSTWTPKTQAAFKEYAAAAGFPEAGINWEAFAKSHEYEPTLNGVYRFWEDTIAEVDQPEARLEKTLEKLSPSTSEAPAATGTKGVTGQKVVTPLGDLYKRIDSYKFIETSPGIKAEFLKQKLQKDLPEDPVAIKWFTNNPLDTVLPPVSRGEDILPVKMTAAVQTIGNKTVESFYEQLMRALGYTPSTKSG